MEDILMAESYNQLRELNLFISRLTTKTIYISRLRFKASFRAELQLIDRNCFLVLHDQPDFGDCIINRADICTNLIANLSAAFGSNKTSLVRYFS